MSNAQKQMLASLVVQLVIGFAGAAAGAVLGAYTAVPLLDQRVDYVERDIGEVKDMAIRAHERINHFHAGG